MDFQLTAEQAMFQTLFRDFAAKEVAKVADQTDKAEEVPVRLLKRAAGQGFFGVLAGAQMSDDPHGGGLDMVTYTLLIEALAAECASTALILHVHNALALRTVTAHATDSARETLVPEMAAGKRIGAFALTEAGAGSDPTRLRTVARREGDTYVLDGAKTWVSNGGPAGIYVIFAATDLTAGARGLSAFVVPAETAGLVVGGREQTLGLRGTTITRLYLRDARIPATHRLGAEGDGYGIALAALDAGRVGISAAALGIAARALELGVAFAATRTQFGAAIGNKQAIQAFLADAATEVAAAQWLVRHAAWLADQGRPFTREAAMAKLFTSRIAAEVTDNMLQIHGGAGFILTYPIERYYRDARALELVEGTSQIQQIVIAGGLLANAGIKVRP